MSNKGQVFFHHTQHCTVLLYHSSIGTPRTCAMTLHHLELLTCSVANSQTESSQKAQYLCQHVADNAMVSASPVVHAASWRLGHLHSDIASVFSQRLQPSAAHLWEPSEGLLSQGALCGARGAVLSQRLAGPRLRGSRRRRRRSRAGLPTARAPLAGARRRLSKVPIRCVILGCQISSGAAFPLCILFSGCISHIGRVLFWLLFFR